MCLVYTHCQVAFLFFFLFSIHIYFWVPCNFHRLIVDRLKACKEWLVVFECL